MSNSLRTHGLQHARLLYTSLFPEVWSNMCPLSQWWYPIISSSVTLFSSWPRSFSPSGSFPMSWLLASGGQSIGASVSVLPMNIQGWCPSGLTGLISLQSMGLSRVFSSTIVQKHQFFGTQPSTVQLSHPWGGKTIEFCTVGGHPNSWPSIQICIYIFLKNQNFFNVHAIFMWDFQTLYCLFWSKKLPSECSPQENRNISD